MQGAAVSPESHMFPFWNVHGERARNTTIMVPQCVNHVVMTITHGLLLPPEKYTNITAAEDADAALRQALTPGGGLAGVEGSRYALPMRQPSVHPNVYHIIYGDHAEAL